MRDHRMGVRDVSAVSCRTWSARHTPSGDDCGRARGKRDTSLVRGNRGAQRDASREPCRNGIGIRDSARSEYGSCCIHRQGPRGSHRVRGDRVGVGDGVEVSCCARITWYSASGDDDGRSRRKRNAVMVGRSCRAQCYAATEPCWNGLNLGHYSRVQHGACHIHWAGPRGTHRV